MSARLELLLRSALARLGTAAVSAPLVLLAIVYVAVAEAWTRLGSAAAARALVGSPAFAALALGLGLDAAARVARATRRDGGETGEGRVGRMVLAGAQALAALAFVATITARDRLVVRLAAGEEYTGALEQFVDRDPPRPLSPGPMARKFLVTEVRAPSGGVDQVALALPGGSHRTLRRGIASWFGWGRFLRPVRAGRAVRYEVVNEASGANAESAFAKLDLAPGGAPGVIRLANVPYRIHLRAAPDAPDGSPRVAASVYRGALRVAEGPADAPLRFEGLTVRFPEWRWWVDVEMLRDPGIPLAILAALAAGIGAALPRGARAATATGARDTAGRSQ
jgi:hypothetical protein